MSKYIRPYGNPNGNVFGKLGEILYTDDGKIYYKADNDGANIGWVQTFPVVPVITPTPTPFPTATPIPTYNPPPPTPTPTSTPTPTATPVPTIPGSTPIPTPAPTTSAPTPTPDPTLRPGDPTPTPTPSPTPTPTSTPTPTATPPPVFKFTSATLIGATYYNDANSLILGVSSVGSAIVGFSWSWTRPATPDDPVKIESAGYAFQTLTSNETSFSLTGGTLNNGYATVSFVRNSLTGDTATITVNKQSGTGYLSNVSGRCLTTAYTAMDLNVSGITSTYDYNIRNCTAGTNSPRTSLSNSYQPTTTGTINPSAISFIEFVNTGVPFAYPSLSPVLP